MNLSGYIHPAYADSLSEFGEPIELSASGGWILKRSIGESDYFDAMGCYPIFACRDWSKLAEDLESLDEDLVTIAIVTDPFGEYSEEILHRCFSDVVIPFKEHHIVDLVSPDRKISSHHRYYAKKVMRTVHIEICDDPSQHLDEWNSLYGNLISRHGLSGIKAFSRWAFSKQLCVPGMVMLRAVDGGETVGAMLWYIQNETAYSHLMAASERGYQLSASYGLYWYAIEYFTNKVRYLDLGAGAGVSNNQADGLALFKQGWSTGTRKVYFCGRINNQKVYDGINNAIGLVGSNYFPLYRKGEFG